MSRFRSLCSLDLAGFSDRLLGFQSSFSESSSSPLFAFLACALDSDSSIRLSSLLRGAPRIGHRHGVSNAAGRRRRCGAPDLEGLGGRRLPLMAGWRICDRSPDGRRFCGRVWHAPGYWSRGSLDDSVRADGRDGDVRDMPRPGRKRQRLGSPCPSLETRGTRCEPLSELAC